MILQVQARAKLLSAPNTLNPKLYGPENRMQGTHAPIKYLLRPLLKYSPYVGTVRPKHNAGFISSTLNRKP